MRERTNIFKKHQENTYLNNLNKLKEKEVCLDIKVVPK